MPFDERKKILLGFSCVDKVVKSIDKDNTVCETLKNLRKKIKLMFLPMVGIEKR